MQLEKLFLSNITGVSPGLFNRVINSFIHLKMLENSKKNMSLKLLYVGVNLEFMPRSHENLLLP